MTPYRKSQAFDFSFRKNNELGPRSETIALRADALTPELPKRVRVHLLRPQIVFSRAANSRQRATLNITVQCILIYYEVYLQPRKR